MYIEDCSMTIDQTPVPLPPHTAKWNNKLERGETVLWPQTSYKRDACTGPDIVNQDKAENMSRR